MSRVKKRRWVVVLVVVLVVRTRRYRLTTVQAKLHVDVAGMVQTALERSRSGNFVSRVYREATGGRVETRVRLRIAYSHPAVQGFVARVAHATDRPAQSAKVVPSPTSLVTVPSRNGRAIYRRGLVRVLENRLLHPP